ncbi:MAG: hypothetical protein NZ585_11940 [Chloracidobacterium sp.]|nr:hypothetical protein [Chloracidobacterium sp.]MDW8218219.1 hypothetical protein [Acidobacteriota bacterium]
MVNPNAKLGPALANRPRRTGWLVAGVLAGLLTAACREAPRHPHESAARPALLERLARGEVQLERLGMTLRPEQPFFGRIIEIAVRNTSSKPLLVVLEPGQLLRSQDPAVTDLVVTSREEIALDVGQSAQREVEVFSLSRRKLSMTRETVYTLGNLTGGDVYTFVTCFATNRPAEPPPPPPGSKLPPQKLDLTPVQLALWCIADGLDRKALLEGIALNPMLKGGEYGRSRDYFDGQAKYVQGLLDRCGLGKYKF